MPQAYSDPTRADDPYALPNIEVFQVTETMWETCPLDPWTGPGWYWWSCFPLEAEFGQRLKGYLPDSDPLGPFPTEADALADAQWQPWDDDRVRRPPWARGRIRPASLSSDDEGVVSPIPPSTPDKKESK